MTKKDAIIYILQNPGVAVHGHGQEIVFDGDCVAFVNRIAYPWIQTYLNQEGWEIAEKVEKKNPIELWDEDLNISCLELDDVKNYLADLMRKQNRIIESLDKLLGDKK